MNGRRKDQKKVKYLEEGKPVGFVGKRGSEEDENTQGGKTGAIGL